MTCLSKVRPGSAFISMRVPGLQRRLAMAASFRSRGIGVHGTAGCGPLRKSSDAPEALDRVAELIAAVR